MIFASVGSMLPFERFVRAVDEWAEANPMTPVYLQIGETQYEPRHCPFARMMPIDEYRRRLRECSLFVAHAGMGSVLQALEDQKQTLLMVRDSSIGEHTTDHQTHTAAKLSGRSGLVIVGDVKDLQTEMSRLLKEPAETGPALIPTAPQLFTDAIALFLNRLN